MFRFYYVCLLIPLLMSCHPMGTPCHIGAPRWVIPTKAERQYHNVPEKDRARFQLVATHSKYSKDSNYLLDIIKEGDVFAFRMTRREKKDTLLKGSIRSLGYFMMKYAHLAIAVRDENNPDQLRLYTSEAFRGPNLIDELGVITNYSFDVYRLDKSDRLNMHRLREFAFISANKTNKWFGYNFLGMLGIWSNMLEPVSISDIGDDYICSTSVAAALHYAGLDLANVRCCEVFNLISPWLIISSQGRLYKPE
ncbi:MAG: hypothetical protein HN759_04330 [Akkermansiaceae bacterium]|jgi:hypothetical protein|nr:hypothetical protein [Akkermansiaceae bacterium]